MNKRVLFACGIALLLLIIGCIVGLSISSKKKKQVKLENSDYPITYEIKKNGSMVIKIDGKKTKDIVWSYALDDESIVSVTQKGKETGGKAKYVITPQAEGLCGVSFKKSSDVGGYQYDSVIVRVPIYVVTENGKLKISLLDNPKVSIGYTAYADDTSYPFLFGINEEGYPDILFVNGINDWSVSDSSGLLQAGTSTDSNGKTHLILTQVDPKTGIIKNTTVAVSSASLGITKEVDITIDVNGNFSIDSE